MGFEEKSTPYNVIFRHDTDQFKLDFAHEFASAFKSWSVFPKPFPIYLPM